MPNKIKILIVEDEPTVAERLKLTIEKAVEDIDIQLIEFDTALEAIQEIMFDVLILDLYRGNPADDDRAGEEVWRKSWETRLRPVIFHSAAPAEIELHPGVPNDNPLIKFQTKAEDVENDSGQRVVEFIESFKPYILDLRKVEDEFNKVIKDIVAQVVPQIWRATESKQEEQDLRSDLLVRSVRRRLAARMDMPLSDEEFLLSWEQYVCPPLEKCLLTADVLRDTKADAQNPESFCIVLTPSCDLEIHNDKCKTESVLVAKCVGVNEFLSKVKISLKPGKRDDALSRLPQLLTQSQWDGYVPLPEYIKVLPHLAANLKKLELIPYSEISLSRGDGKRYERVTSIDSPFREQLVWAYMQTSCRPGIPNRDTVKWAQEMLDSTNPKKQIEEK